LRVLVVAACLPLGAVSASAGVTPDQLCKEDDLGPAVVNGRDTDYQKWGPRQSRHLHTSTKATDLSLAACTGIASGRVFGFGHARNEWVQPTASGIPAPQVQYHYFRLYVRLYDSAERSWYRFCSRTDVSGDDIQHVECKVEGEYAPTLSYYTYSTVCYDVKDDGQGESCLASTTPWTRFPTRTTRLPA
jgi:hypothetical protein